MRAAAEVEARKGCVLPACHDDTTPHAARVRVLLLLLRPPPPPSLLLLLPSWTRAAESTPKKICNLPGSVQSASTSTAPTRCRQRTDRTDKGDA